MAPTVKGNTFTFKESARSTVFNGHAVQPAKVEIEVDPPSGNLVRDASNYELIATGSVRFGQEPVGEPIVGKYSCLKASMKIVVLRRSEVRADA